MSTPGKVHLTTLALIVWGVLASPEARGQSCGQTKVTAAAAAIDIAPFVVTSVYGSGARDVTSDSTLMLRGAYSSRVFQPCRSYSARR
jgi:hypothetical protein